MNMERTFQIVAVMFIAIAAYFLWTDGAKDGAFVAGVFAFAAGLLSYRFRLKARLSHHKVERDDI